jgi:hypothetical protein
MKKKSRMYIETHRTRHSRGNENALSQPEPPPLWLETVQQLHVIKS